MFSLKRLLKYHLLYESTKIHLVSIKLNTKRARSSVGMKLIPREMVINFGIL